MRRTPAVSATLFLLVATACSGAAPVESPSPTTPAATAPTTPVETAPATPVETAEEAACPFPIGIADVPYGTLVDYASAAGAGGVAIAEVVHVGPVQYSTESGARPSCDELAAKAHGPVGRRIQLRVTEPVVGEVAAGHVVTYVLPGGAIGDDVSPGHHWNLETPEEGDPMVVFLLEDPIDLDGGPGVFEQDVLDLLAIDADGRILTPNPDERVTVDSVATLLGPPAD